MIMTRPMRMRRQMHGALAPLNLTNVVGHALFASSNWHQSLSDWHDPSSIDALRHACSQLEAHAFCFRLDRFVSTGKQPGDIHWALRSQHGDPPGFLELLDELRRVLRLSGIDDQCRHSAHVTLSYFAQQGLANASIEPV